MARRRRETAERSATKKPPKKDEKPTDKQKHKKTKNKKTVEFLRIFEGEFFLFADAESGRPSRRSQRTKATKLEGGGRSTHCQPRPQNKKKRRAFSTRLTESDRHEPSNLAEATQKDFSLATYRRRSAHQIGETLAPRISLIIEHNSVGRSAPSGLQGRRHAEAQRRLLTL